MKRKFISTTTTTTPVGAGDISAEPAISKSGTGLLAWIGGIWKYFNVVTSWSENLSDENIPTEKLVKNSIQGIKLKKFQIPSNGISDDNTGIISGISTFDLPADFDVNSANFVQDGSMLAQYSINIGVTPKTITFNLVPLKDTCFLFYYSL